jgi:ATP-dependent exoDNAse (exonuclease V) beta subunit
MRSRAGEPVDREARERAARDLDRSFCVEAGAGTGKTTLLVERFLAIVESGRAAVEEVVAITFTEKAAGEMKIRIRREIERRLSGDAAVSPGRRNLEAALDRLERAPISTIHSFAASVLREHPVEAGIDPMFTQLDALEGSLFFDECWSDFLLGRAEVHGEAIRRFVSLGGSVAHLPGMARAAYERRGERSCEGIFAEVPAGPPPGDRGRGSSPRRESPPLDVEELRGAFMGRIERLRVLARNDCTNESDRGFAAIAELVGEAARLETIRGEDLERALLSLEISKPKGNKSNWRPPGSCAAQKGVFEELARLQGEARARVSDAVAAALDDLFDAFLRFAEERKAAGGLLDFDDLLIRMRELCKRPAALDALRRRYRFLLVDEFQDTDPLQAEIIWLLACGRGDGVDAAPARGKLFIVGDPKQSIYRFRKADVEIYELVKERLVSGGGDRLSIVQNFRSVPGIVEWVNGTFSALMQPPPEGRYQPRYDEIRAWRPGDGAPVVVFDLEMEEEKPSSGAVRRREGEAVARIVRHLVSSGLEVMDPATRLMEPLSYRHVAIVYPGTTGIDNYEDPLRAENIPYIVEGGKLYYTREEIRALASAVWAIEDPYDPLALLGALRSPLFGASDEEIFLFTRAGGRLEYLDPGAAPCEEFPDLAASFGLLRELHLSRNDAGPSRTMLALLARTKFLELSLLRPHGDQRAANIRKAVAGARAFDAAAGGYRRFARWFRDQEVLASEESESPMVEEDENAVRLLTVHKAKGLQFPVVILANLVQSRRAGPRIVVGPCGRLAFRIGDSLETGDFETLAERENLRENAETVRLLYVAATRAGDLLVVPRAPKGGGYFDIVGGNLEPGRGPVAEWRFSAMPPLRGDDRPFVRLDEPPPAERERHERLREEWRLRRLALIDRASRAPALIAPSRLAPERAEEAERRAPDEAPARGGFPARRAALFGEAFHRVMERAEPGEASALFGLSASVAADLGIDGEAAALERLAASALDSDLMKRASRAARRFREAPFIVPVAGGFVQGRIDLLFEEEGRWTAVDFKTDDIAEDAIEERLASYRPQAAVYALALVRLGFETPGEIVLFFVRPLVARSIAVTDALLAEAEELIRAAAARPL